MKKFIFVLSLLILAGFAYANHENYNGQDHNDAFQNGYLAGYEHGFRDQQARVNFDFRHANEYESAEGIHNSYDTHASCDFRVGYLEGYADGYFRKSPLVSGAGYEDRGGGYSVPGSGFGGVVVFTERGYKGAAQNFGVGQYQYLRGEWNDSIESVRIQGNFRVILFDLSEFRGERIVLDQDAWDLGGFRRRAASMIIEPIGRR